MEKRYGKLSHWFLFALGLVIAFLWVVFCFNSEIDRTGGLVLSRFFLEKSISVWVFLGVGVVLFFIALGLFIGLVRFLEDKRSMAFYNKPRAQKLNIITVILGIVMLIALLAMIVGAVTVLTSSGSDGDKPGTIYYYYYY